MCGGAVRAAVLCPYTGIEEREEVFGFFFWLSGVDLFSTPILWRGSGECYFSIGKEGRAEMFP